MGNPTLMPNVPGVGCDFERHGVHGVPPGKYGIRNDYVPGRQKGTRLPQQIPGMASDLAL